MANQIDVQIGSRVREARLAKGMSQRELSEALEVSSQLVQKYEWGNSPISCSRIWKISNVLETTIDFFFDSLDQDGRSKEAHSSAPNGHLSGCTVQLMRTLNALGDEGVKDHFLCLIRDFERIG